MYSLDVARPPLLSSRLTTLLHPLFSPPPERSTGSEGIAENKDRSAAKLAQVQREALLIPPNGVYRFPELVLVELEASIFRDSWLVPVEENESFGICLQAAAQACADPSC